MLYMIATPIGNLKDITLRALEILQSCDYILCEDTRQSTILLNHYGIRKPLKSFHRFNEKKMEKTILEDLRLGKEVCLISDAGTPGICDPGEQLIKRCYEENISITSIPGPSAWIVALSLCPFSKEWVQFVGFLPKKISERKRRLATVLSIPATTIFYESPHRIVEVLKEIEPSRHVCIFRELTKKFEEKLIGSSQELRNHFEKHTPLGEFVVIVEGISHDFTSLSPQDHVRYLMETYDVSKMDAIKIVADLSGVAKKTIYNSIL